MEYWRRQRLKEIMKHIVVVVLIVAACIGINSWDKEVL